MKIWLTVLVPVLTYQKATHYSLGILPRCYVIAQGVAFAGPAVCMVACALLTPAGAAHAPGSSPTTLIVALFSAAFAMGAWARAGLYCNHQVQRSSMLQLLKRGQFSVPKAKCSTLNM